VKALKKDITCTFKGYNGPSVGNIKIPISVKRNALADKGPQELIMPEFEVVVKKFDKPDVFDLLNDDGNVPLPDGFCPFEAEWSLANNPRCLCSANHTLETTCPALNHSSGAQGVYLRAICHPIVCSKPIANLPVIRLMSELPFSGFADLTAVEFRIQLISLLSQQNVTEVYVINIGPWKADPNRTYIDVQYYLPVADPNAGNATILNPNSGLDVNSGDATNPQPAILDPNQGIPPPTSGPPMVPGILPQPERLVESLPASLQVSAVQHFSSYTEARNSDPNAATSLETSNGKLTILSISLITVGCIVFLALGVIGVVVLRNRPEPSDTDYHLT